jgi:hypothetical protein
MKILMALKRSDWLRNRVCDFFNQKKIIRGKNRSDDLDLKFFT